MREVCECRADAAMAAACSLHSVLHHLYTPPAAGLLSLHKTQRNPVPAKKLPKGPACCYARWVAFKLSQAPLSLT